MRARTRWLLAGGAVVVILGAGAAYLLASQSPPAAAPSATPTAEATTAPPIEEQVRSALDAHLSACAESTAAAPPEHCGIRIPWGTEFSAVSGIRFRIETMPVLQIDGEVFTADEGVLVATVTGTGQDGTARTETYRTEDWTVRGDVVQVDGQVDIEVW